jgi:transposase
VRIATDRTQAPTAIRTNLGAIFLSMDLSRTTWLLTSLSPGDGERMSKHAVRSGDVAGLLARFSQLKDKVRLRTGQVVPIVVVQEAGLDGFWIHRLLQDEGIESYVVDPASIAMSRRRRRAKTDKIDGESLVRALLAYKRGEPRVCAMVKAPTPQEEDRRRICRERKTLTAERVRHVNRIKGLLFAQGISDYEPLRRKRRERLEELRTGDGRPLPQHLKAQIGRELDRLELILQQIRSVETERDALLSPSKDGAPAPGAMLKSLKGIGPEFAGVLWSEGLYRSFSNRRQVAAYAGLAPTPWQSGSVAHEQGVSKAGNPRLRTTMIQLAWLWVRHQPGSILAQWFHQRVQFNGGRPEGTDRCLGPKAADRLLEICDRRDRTGRSRDRGCLSTSAPQSSGARSAPADPGERTEIWPGSKSRKREWFRSPEPSPDASGILVQPTRESGDRM